MRKSFRDAGFRSEHGSHTKATDRVYWTRKFVHVSDAQKLVSCNMEWYHSSFVFGACAQSYRSCKDSEKHDKLFRCPCTYLCSCQVQFKICETRDYTKVMISGRRDGNNHVEAVRDKVYQKLSLNQTGALRRATKVAPNGLQDRSRAIPTIKSGQVHAIRSKLNSGGPAFCFAGAPKASSAIKTIIFSSFHRIFLEKIIALFCSGNFAGRGRAYLESSALALFNFFQVL